MTTVYDWITVALFAGLIGLFLHRSDQATPPPDALWHYLIAAGGCAVVNWLGNNDHPFIALAVGLGLVTFIVRVLKPFDSRPR